MIQYLHNKRTGLVSYILIGLIAIPFIFIGTTSLFQSSTRVTDIATIDGNEVSSYQYYRALREKQNLILEQFGDSVSSEDISDEIIGPLVLRELLQREALNFKLLENGMAIDHKAIKTQIVNLPQFQIDEQFSPGLYRENLLSIGFTSHSFIAELETSEINRQFKKGIAASVFSDDKTFSKYLEILGENRSFDYIKLSIDNEISNTEVQEKEIFDYYETNKQQYIIDDQVKVNYIVLDKAKVAESVQVTEAEIQSRYELLQDQEVQQSSEVAHILIENKSDGSHAEVLQTIKDKLANGETFEDLAKQYSDDVGSSDSGGYLGFTTGDSFPETFEQAVSNLATKGDISDIVVTDSGSHLIKLLSKTSNEFGSIEDERLSIIEELKLELADVKFNQVIDRINELAFPESNLNPVAETIKQEHPNIGIKIATSGFFTKKGNPEDPIGKILELIKVAFSESVVNQGRNSEVVIVNDTELAIDAAYILHKADVKPRHIPELELIKDKIIENLKADKANQALHKKSQELFKIVRDGKSVEELAKQRNLDWQVRIDASRSDPYEPNTTLFQVESATVPYNKIIKDYDGNYYIVHVYEVGLGDIDDYSKQQLDSTRRSYNQLIANLEVLAISNYIYNNANIDTDLPLTNR